MKNPQIKLTLEQRKLILQLMNYSYTIPQEYHNCVADAIKKYATKQYSDNAIYKMVQKSQSIANSGFLLREDSISLFRGKFAEWLACIEYNAMKNSGAVIMTIVNPDESSKADLLHFIKVGDEFKAVAGPDIKSGGSTYVFNQWKKIVNSRYDIPMVDFDGVLSTEEGLRQLTKNQRDEFELLCEKYPKKSPIPSTWSNMDELRLRMDYFKSVLGMEGNFQYSPEVANLLKASLAKKRDNLPQTDWTDFNKKCKEIFKDFNPSAEQCLDFVEEEKVPKLNNKIPEDTQAFGLSIGSKGKTFLGKLLDVDVKIPDIPWGKVVLGGLGVIVTAGTGVAIYKSNTARKAITELGETILESPSTTELIKDVVDTVSKEPLGGTHASPILHKVSGYMKKNGTKVADYWRGGKV